jgi:hypothetical protein
MSSGNTAEPGKGDRVGDVSGIDIVLRFGIYNMVVMVVRHLTDRVSAASEV